MIFSRKLNVLLLFVSFFISASCKKGGDNAPPAAAPSNLVVNAVVSTDGSGNVSFTATADNAVSYVFNFGDGNSLTSATGAIQNKYTTSGTNTYSVTVTAKNSGNLTTSKTISITVNYVATLVWSDEFATDGLPDATKWGYDIGGNGWGNQELEFYTNRIENAVISGGTLKINAIRENYSGNSFTSARMLTKDKYAFKYGKVEVKAKLPSGVGTWPAIWMLGSDISTVSWPACGEIDIMEHLGRDLNNIYGTLHYPGRSGGNADGATKRILNATSEFHVYTVEWSAALIKISVDGEQVHSVVNSFSIPFNHEFFIILNVAMGGNFSGPVDASVNNATMEVDYVRVYQ